MPTGPSPKQLRQAGADASSVMTWDGNNWVPGLKSNFSATTAPTVNDDNTQNYEIGSVWVNTLTDVYYVCVDATTGAAVWLDLTTGTGGTGPWDITAEIDNGDSPYTATINELIQVDTTVGDVTINLPAVSSGNTGEKIGVKVVVTGDPINDIIITPNGSDTIDWWKLMNLDISAQWCILVSDGIDNWIQMG